MSVEYTPEFNLSASQAKLLTIVSEQVEVPDQLLFEGIIDVLASRGGERWKKLDELRLSTNSQNTKSSMIITVGFDDPSEGNFPNQAAWISILQADQTTKEYEVAQLEKDLYELREITDIETGEKEAVSNTGGLADGRLLSILAEAHNLTPLQKLTDDDYNP